MNTRAINQAAGIICRAQEKGRQTPAALAMAIDAAGMLMSPETAAELADLRARAVDVPVDEEPVPFILTPRGHAAASSALLSRLLGGEPL